VAETKYLPVLCDAMMKNALEMYSEFLQHGIAVVCSLGARLSELIRVLFSRQVFSPCMGCGEIGSQLESHCSGCVTFDDPVTP
jgi:hypothetical protein